MKRLKELDIENATLKRIVADESPLIAALNDASKGNCEPVLISGFIRELA